MCTLILAWRVFDDAPIAAAANRDEALGRPSRPPGVLDEEPRVVAPQDEEAGGTWIGYNDAGVFVAVTNRRAGVEGERSRGLLVRDALARESASAASSYVKDELADRQYAGFNLVVADREEAGLLEWDGVLRTTHFDPGVHVVVNEGYNGAAPKAETIREAVRPDPTTGDKADDATGGTTDDATGGTTDDATGGTTDATGEAARDSASETDSAEWFERAKAVLRDHDLGACVHADDYGTRSSSLVAIDAAGAGRYWFADGRPCETDYEEVGVERPDR